MITTLLFDFSRVVLLPKDKNYQGGLNSLYREVSQKPGFKFDDYFELNQLLVEFLEDLKDRYELYVFTKGTIQEAPEIAPSVKRIFKQVFSAEKLGLDKENENSFLKILEMIGKRPDDLLYIDDKIVNVEAAKTAGLHGIQYKSFAKLKKDLENRFFRA